MSTMIIVFAVVLVLVAVLTKVVGCGLGAKLCKYSNQDCMRIGTGMISRGEVALIVASKGNAVGLMSADLLGPVVIVVVITTIIAPIFLKMTFSGKKKESAYEENNLMKKVHEREEEEKQDKSRFITEDEIEN